MRTPEEILKRIEEVKDQDPFGFETSDLLEALDYTLAKPYLREDCTKQEWDESREPYTPEAARNKIRNYLAFAWDKANTGRGLSAVRSQSHFKAWMWLAGDDDVLQQVEAVPHDPYGIPKLKVIEAHYTSTH